MTYNMFVSYKKIAGHPIKNGKCWEVHSGPGNRIGERNSPPVGLKVLHWNWFWQDVCFWIKLREGMEITEEMSVIECRPGCQANHYFKKRQLEKEKEK